MCNIHDVKVSKSTDPAEFQMRANLHAKLPPKRAMLSFCWSSWNQIKFNGQSRQVGRKILTVIFVIHNKVVFELKGKALQIWLK